MRYCIVYFKIEEVQLLYSGASPPESPSITEGSINYIQLDLDNTGSFGFDLFAFTFLTI